MYRTEQEIEESPAVQAAPQRRKRAWWDSSARPPSARRQPTWWSRLPTVVRRAIVFVVLIAFWQAYVSLKHVSPLVFSSPASSIKALVSGWGNGQIASATVTTLEVLLIGMAIGLVLGVLFTVFATATTVGRDFVMLMTAMVNPLPSIAILPLAIIWFGINNKALVFVIANAVVWPIAINMSAGFTTINPTLVMAAQNLGLKGWRMVKDILLPAALPSIMSGVKVSWAFGWRTVIAAELVFGTAGGSGGLGYYINKNQYFLTLPNVFAGLITIAVIGVIVQALLNVFEKETVVRWGMARP